MRTRFFFLLCFLYSLPAQAQLSQTRSIGVAYFAAYGYQPGISLKAEQLLGMKKAAAYGSEAARVYPFLAVELGAYAHLQNNLYLNMGVQGGWRRIGTKGRCMTFFASLGALRAQHLINSYRLNGAGELVALGKTGNMAFLPGIGLGFGGNPGVALEKNRRIYCNIRAQFQIPYGHSYLIHPMLELGTYFGGN